MKKIFGFFALSAVLLTGCQTTRSYQPDIDALNAKVDSLQGQLQQKNREVGQLSDTIRTLESQLASSERSRRDAEGRLGVKSPKASGYDKQGSGYDKQPTSAPAQDPYAK